MQQQQRTPDSPDLDSEAARNDPSLKFMAKLAGRRDKTQKVPPLKLGAGGGGGGGQPVTSPREKPISPQAAADLLPKQDPTKEYFQAYANPTLSYFDEAAERQKTPREAPPPEPVQHAPVSPRNVDPTMADMRKYAVKPAPEVPEAAPVKEAVDPALADFVKYANKPRSPRGNPTTTQPTQQPPQQQQAQQPKPAAAAPVSPRGVQAPVSPREVDLSKHVKDLEAELVAEQNRVAKLEAELAKAKTAPASAPTPTPTTTTGATPAPLYTKKGEGGEVIEYYQRFPPPPGTKPMSPREAMELARKELEEEAQREDERIEAHRLDQERQVAEHQATQKERRERGEVIPLVMEDPSDPTLKTMAKRQDQIRAKQPQQA